MSAASPTSPARPAPPRRWPYVAAVLVAAAVVVAAAAAQHVRATTERLDAVERSVQRVASTSASRIATWRGERLADARAIASAAALTPAVASALSGTLTIAGQQGLHEWLRTIRAAYGYAGVAFITTSGDVAISAGAVPASAPWLRELGTTSTGTDVIWRADPTTPSRYVMATALPPSAPGTLVLVVEPASALAPLLKWPDPASPGQVLLETGAPAAATTALLTAHAEVPGTGWSVLATLPRDAALAPLDAVRVREGVIVAILIALAATLAAFGWRNAVTAHERQRANLAATERAMEARLAEAVRESRERLALAFDAAREGYWDWREDGPGFTSERYHAMLGYADGTLTPGRAGLTALVHPHDRATLDAAFDGVAAPGPARQDQFDIELRLRAADGTYRWVASRGMVVARRADGAPRRIAGTHADMTALRALADQLHQSQKLESLGRLAGGIAHDFNNLLTVINGYGELLASRLARDPQLADASTQIVKAGHRAADLTQQLLAFSRKQISEPRPLGVNALVRDAHPLLMRLVGADVRVVAALDADPDLIVADPGQLHQVLVNLVVNARDAMPRGGTITIGTASTPAGAADAPRGVTLSVADTGTGMSEDVRAHIFEPFFTTKAPGKGTGLGLATVYGIVQQHRGRIDVTSAPGQGTMFALAFPMAEPAAAADTPTVPSVLDGHETVLVVEDQPDVRTLIVSDLRARGYRAIEAANAAEALTFAGAHDGPIDVLVTDVMLPDQSGTTLASALAATHAGLQTLYMSGYSAAALVEQGLLASGIPCLQKPFRRDELAARLRGLLTVFRPVDTIIVVDDDSAIRGWLQRVLAPLGREILMAASAEEALELAADCRHVDILVADLMLPDGNSVPVIEYVRRQFGQTRVLVITGAADDALIERARRAGATAVLRKPVDAQSLQDVITGHAGTPPQSIS